MNGKKKLLVFLAPLVILGVLLSLIITLVLGGAIKKKEAESASDCPDTSMPAGASYTGDLGTIRAPWVGAAAYTSKFGMRVNPGRLWKGQYRMHEGVDVAETPRPTLIVSATKGQVKRVYTAPEGANVVEIDVGGNTVLSYIHLASFAPGLKAGDRVWPGRPVGVEGETGNASGPHLHFQVEVAGKPVEPWGWMKEHGFQAAPAPSAEGSQLPSGPPAVAQEPKDSGSGKSATSGASSSSSGDGATGQPAAYVAATSSSSTSSSSASASSSGSSSATSGTVEGAKITLPQGTGPGKEASSNPALPIPADFLALYKASGAKHGVPWQLLAGIGMAETGHGRNKAVSSAGAQGPMQFMPQYFPAYATDADGDGKISILSPADAIFAAGKKLKEDGATKGPQGIRSAILAYNHSQEYVNSVLTYTKFYAGGQATFTAASGEDSAGACGVAGVSNPDEVKGAPASSAYEKAALEAASQYLGTPYVWGGGDQNGPTKGGFDCSGFTMYVVAQATKKATGKELVLSHLTTDQHVTPSMATVATYSGSGPADTSKMRVGDIIVFNLQLHHDWDHVGIYIGNGKMIHAPKPGKVVEVADLKNTGQGAWTARRPLAEYTGPSGSSSSSSSSSATSTS